MNMPCLKVNVRVLINHLHVSQTCDSYDCEAPSFTLCNELSFGISRAQICDDLYNRGKMRVRDEQKKRLEGRETNL
jgi:hypothetical protein